MQPVYETFYGYLITTDKSLMNTDDVYRWISEEAYWGNGLPRYVFDTSFNNSFCIGVILDGQQIGFARLVTDYAVFGYLADVFVVEAHRGKGLGKQMMAFLFGLLWVQRLRGIKLQTRDTHGLYRQFGFGECQYPERIMEISRPDINKTL